jgi:hypothetical protein
MIMLRHHSGIKLKVLINPIFIGWINNAGMSLLLEISLKIIFDKQMG